MTAAECDMNLGQRLSSFSCVKKSTRGLGSRGLSFGRRVEGTSIRTLDIFIHTVRWI